MKLLIIPSPLEKSKIFKLLAILYKSPYLLQFVTKYINDCIFLVTMVLQNCLRVDEKDLLLMRNECKILFLKSHPEMKGIVLPDKYMFKRLVEFYLQ